MRDTYGVIAIGVVAVAAAVGFFTFGGTLSPAAVQDYTGQASATRVLFRELAHGVHSKIETRVNYVITSPSELTELWKLVDAKGEAPTIDFAHESVLAVFAGSKSTGGYNIRVSEVVDAASRKVVVALTDPSGGCVLAKGATDPYQIIAVPKTTLALTHEDTTTTVGCK